MNDRIVASSRRNFLKFLAGSPLFASTVAPSVLAAAQGGVWSAEAAAELPIANPAQALNVFDLEAVARRTLPPAHFAYLATGVESDATVRANREGFNKFAIRPRRLVDTSKLDTRVELLGTTWPTPIALSPVSSIGAFHADGEIAVAKGARVRNHLQIMSTLATRKIEDINEARGMPVWFQLYPTVDWNITVGLIKRAESAGCKVLALTVDNPTSIARETLARGRRLDTRDCSACHDSGPGGSYRRKPMFDGLDVSKLRTTLAAHLDWNFVRRLQDTTSMKILLKGIVTAEDAALAVEHRVDGIIVSNHGGRGEESARSTIEALPEVVDAVGGRMPVLVDSGFRRGTDIFKALAMGANAVCVGRPYVWGLAAFGQPGVERALDMLRMELETTMKSMGTPTVKSINRNFLVRV
ncbi:MAG TPA: alpha-hydroxy acid oxidase [Burkholderiales bacterium]|nr:alpha-hydroxy acid oxidase [Burkholderiales bacterium]